MLRRILGPLLIALAVFLATLLTLAPDGCGPGVTCDESYHIYHGKQLVTALRQQGFAFFCPANIDRNFAWEPGGPPVQAPLGYWILGGIHHLFDPAPNDPTLVSVSAARFAPALAFALLVLIVGAWVALHESRFAGTVAALAVALTPRLFGHAHLAALDMLTTLFFIAAILAAAEAARHGRVWQFALAGVVWGLAMLVRLHGLLVAPPVVLWLLWRLRRKAVLPLIAWLSAGGLTLFVGWPWLWLAPIARFHQYLSSGTSREMLHVFYAGQAWADRDVPWHYPWVMFAVTLPIGFLLLGFVGIWAKRRASDGTGSLVTGTIAFVLLVFSWPGTPVYDGTRLFLMAFPLWAIWVGIGADWLCNWGSRFFAASEFNKRLWTAAVLFFVLLQGSGLVIYAPCQLSYYSLLVGGLPGAERLGFEVTYWGDTIREPMLAEAARLTRGVPAVLFAPDLASFQVPTIEVHSPALRETGVHLIGWSSLGILSFRPQLVLVYNRRADLANLDGLLVRHMGSAPFRPSWAATDLDSLLAQGKVVKEYSNQGVWLARLIELPPPRLPGRLNYNE